MAGLVPAILVFACSVIVILGLDPGSFAGRAAAPFRNDPHSGIYFCPASLIAPAWAMTTRLRPACLARYVASSARRRRSAAIFSSLSELVTATLTVTLSAGRSRP